MGVFQRFPYVGMPTWKVNASVGFFYGPRQLVGGKRVQGIETEIYKGADKNTGFGRIPWQAEELI